MAGYAQGRDSSGMWLKFIPYQPVIRVRGRKMVVTTVRNCMTRFCFKSIFDW